MTHPDISASRAPLDEQLLRTALVLGGPYNRLDYATATGSTNADLLAAADPAAAGPAPDWTVATVERQDSGRGRLGRPWTAPEGAQVIFSVLFRPGQGNLDKLGTIPLACGLALMDTLAELGVPDAGLKWPNDVLVGGRKLCGILVEAASLDTEPVVVIGIGTNISLTEEELPVPHATSLALEGVGVDRNRFLITVLTHLHRRLVEWAGPDTSWLADYRTVCTSIGRDVRVILPGERELLGRATGVAEAGQLQVRDDAGVLHTLNAGEVTHLRLQ